MGLEHRDRDRSHKNDQESAQDPDSNESPQNRRRAVAPGKQTITQHLPPATSPPHSEGAPEQEAAEHQAAAEHQEAAEHRPVRSANEVTHDLRTVVAYDPVAALTDPVAAWGLLPEMPTSEFLRTLEELDSQGFRGILAVHPAPGPREDAAMRLFDLAELEPGAAGPAELAPIAQALAALGPEDQSLLLNAFMRRRGLAYSYEQIAQALPVEPRKQPRPEPGEEPETSGKAVTSEGETAMAGATTPPDAIRPGNWRPGREPAGLYIGKALHRAIADCYWRANPGDIVRTNNRPLRAALASFAEARFEVTPAALAPTALARCPDILNITRLCLYEIKPAQDQAGARTKAQFYIGLLRQGGVTVSLGPSGAPGTMGRIPAPGGVAVFRSPEPGVICYRYHPRAEFVPVPIPRTNEAPDSSPGWEWGLRPLKMELAQPTEEQALALTVGSTLLAILVAILLIPVSA